LKNEPVIQAYSNYYRSFGKTYHVLPQIESMIFKGKKLNLPIPLLQIVFLLELKNMLLTAVHDVAALEPPVKVDVSTGQEAYILLNTSPKTLKPGDMFVRDMKGVISSIIYGPDSRTRISSDTSEAMIVVYAPPGIARGWIDHHFDSIFSLAENVSMQPEIIFRSIYPEV
jgi:DNA/RNA-binding domain of Phe-tRNA-synthetase-like protein